MWSVKRLKRKSGVWRFDVEVRELGVCYEANLRPWDPVSWTLDCVVFSDVKYQVWIGVQNPQVIVGLNTADVS